MVLHCQDSDVDECGAGHEYGKTGAANLRYMFPKIKLLVKSNSLISGRCRWICVNAYEVIGERDKYFFRCCPYPFNRKTVLLGFSFNLL